MDKTSEKDLESVIEKDLADFERDLSSLKGIGKEIAELTDKYTNFRLQLIVIASATFSIYVALQSHTEPQIGFIRYGFITLAVSLLLGTMSIALSLLSKGSVIFYKIFDFDKSVRSRGLEKFLKYLGLPEFQLYDDDFRKLEGKRHSESALRLMRGLLTLSSEKWALLFGIGQILMFLTATILLVFGLLFGTHPAGFTEKVL
jgi:hypothetical protein